MRCEGSDIRSAARLWSEILGSIDLRERLEQSWTVTLRALYPDIGLAELAERFLEPWRRFAEEQLPLEQIEGALEFGLADLPGWQSFAVAVVISAQADHDPEQSGLLNKELSRVLLQAVNEHAPIKIHPLTPVRAGPSNHLDTVLPEGWTAKGEIVGSSRAMRALADKCLRAARDRHSVLLTGETGSGKEVAAKLLHQLSDARGQFIPVNCAALPEALIECELFGYARGAFTGATTHHEGLIRAAEGGTIFLDEISELPLLQQAKLLRVLQDGLVRPLGSTRYYWVDARVIAATNRDLKQILAKEQLRRDLYYRLAVHEIRIPPLREHAEDIPELVASFLSRLRRTNPRFTTPRISREALELLAKARWPGNVRQLENLVYRLASDHPGKLIGASEVQSSLELAEQREESTASAENHEDLSLAALERHAVEQALAMSQGNKAGAARLLGITRKALYNKIQRYRIALTKR